MSIFSPPDPDLLGSSQILDFSSLSPYQSGAPNIFRAHTLLPPAEPRLPLSCLSSLPRASPPRSHPCQHCHPNALAQDPHPDSAHSVQCWTQTSCVQATPGSHLWLVALEPSQGDCRGKMAPCQAHLSRSFYGSHESMQPAAQPVFKATSQRLCTNRPSHP